jgi:hypothetical protein
MNQTVGSVREKWSEFLFWLSVFFGVLHFAGIAGGLAGMNVRSSFLMGNIYLAVLAAYVGQKELRRWLSAPDADVMPGDVQKKFARGEIIVAVWGAATGIIVLLWELGVVASMPEPLIYTFGEVMGIYFGTSASKFFKNNNIKTAMETESVAASCGDKALSLARSGGSIDNETCMKEFNLSRGQAYRLLSRLEKQGRLKAEGSGRGGKYIPAA